MFSSLKIKEFRLFWFAMFTSLIGTWIQSMAQSWLVFEMTQSSFLLGLVGFLNYIPISILVLAAGVFADRHAKRNLLIVTQLSFMVLAFTLAALVYYHKICVWQILILAFLNGVIIALDAPARQAMVVDLVGKQHLLNAIALNSAAFNSARIIGPALAGLLIALTGIAECFFINALSFLPILVVLVLIKPRQPSFVNSKDTSVLSEVKEALRLIGANQPFCGLLIMVGIVSLFGISYIVLMPVFAQDVFHLGARGLAILMTANGLGALAGALSLARLKGCISRFKVFKNAIFLFFISTMLFSFSRSIFISSALLIIAGFGATRGMSMVNTMLQASVPDAFRGRIMGVFVMMLTGLMPFGNLIAGSVAHYLSAQTVVLGGALVSLVLCMIVIKKYFCQTQDTVLVFSPVVG
ncbi:MAG: MFS transporter [Candidatus Omnitrophota bacterium]